mgnify:CR=1 FL=1
MPTMANITVKAADGTTDKVYTALAGSSGEGVAAQWRHEDGSLPTAFRPSFKMTARGSTSGRRITETLHVRPITQVVNGVYSQIGVHTVRTIDTLVMTDATANVNEAVAQGANLNASTLIKQANQEGYAPRG